MKKIIVILVILIVLAGLWLFFSNRPEPTTNNTETGSFPGGENIFPGDGTADETSTTDSETAKPGESPMTTIGSPLLKITTSPIAGASLVGVAPTTTVVFVERATGHIYKFDRPDEPPQRISNTTVPKIYEAFATYTPGLTAQAGNIRLLLRYLKDNRRQNFLASANLDLAANEDGFLSAGDEQEGELTGEFLSPNIYSAAPSPDGKKIFYLEEVSGQTRGTVLDLTGENPPLNIFNSPLRGWLVAWPTPNTIALQTKSSANTESFLYFLDLQTKKIEKVIGPAPGLSTLVSPSGKNVLYSGNGTSRLVFGVFDIVSKTFISLPVRTLADKCVWGQEEVFVYCGVPTTLPAGQYPDDWYRGETSFSDNIWKINIKTKRSEILFNPLLANQPNIDATSLFLDNNEHTLYFINRRDSSLWSLELAAGF